MTALIDESMRTELEQYTWRAVKFHRCWYARTTYQKNNRRFSKSMHRLVAQTPGVCVCHHINRNSLDNRRSNLLNLPHEQHEFLHKNNTLKIKFTEPATDHQTFLMDSPGTMDDYLPENP